MPTMIKACLVFTLGQKCFVFIYIKMFNWGNMIMILIKEPVQFYIRQLTLFATSVLALAFSNTCTVSL